MRGQSDRRHYTRIPHSELTLETYLPLRSRACGRLPAIVLNQAARWGPLENRAYASHLFVGNMLGDPDRVRSLIATTADFPRRIRLTVRSRLFTVPPPQAKTVRRGEPRNRFFLLCLGFYWSGRATLSVFSHRGREGDSDQQSFWSHETTDRLTGADHPPACKRRARRPARSARDCPLLGG